MRKLSIIIFILIFSAICFGQKPTPKSKEKPQLPPKSEPIKGEQLPKSPLEKLNEQEDVSENSCFSMEPLDYSIKVLPSKYSGQNYKFIAKKIIEIDELKKDEFETTAQFLERKEKAQSSPIIGELTSKDIFVFQFNGFFYYNADKELMSAEIYSRYLDWENPCSANSYISEALAIRLKKEFSFDFSIKLEKAKSEKKDLRLLIFGKIKFEKSADRYYSLINKKELTLEADQIWIYNRETGQIYAKISSEYFKEKSKLMQ